MGETQGLKGDARLRLVLWAIGVVIAFIFGVWFRGYLGAWAVDKIDAIRARPVLSATATFGIWVCYLEPRAPARASDMEIGDMVILVQDLTVMNEGSWAEILEERAPGRDARVGVLRWDSLAQVMRPHRWEFLRAEKQIEIRRAEDVCPYGEASYVQSGEGFVGMHTLVITKFGSNSPADRDGLRLGDVIIRVNGMGITHSKQVKNIVENSMSGTEFTFDVLRKSSIEDVWDSEQIRVKSVGSVF